MEILMDYHLLFIVICFCLLLVSIFLLFVDNTKERTVAAIILCGINYILCIINSLAFTSIGLLSYNADGTTDVTQYVDMYPFYAIFYLFVFINVAFIFYGYWTWVRNPWEINDLD